MSTVAIIGAGPAGLSAAVYAASEGLSVRVYEHAKAPQNLMMLVGGQAGTSSRIENYLGFPNGLSGADFVKRAHAQATRLGAVFWAKNIEGIGYNTDRRILLMDDGVWHTTDVIIIAAGVHYKHLDVLDGAGRVHYGAATHLAHEYQGDHVVVIGAANSAGQAALHLAKYAATVTMLVRSDGIEASMSDYLVKRIHAHPDIHVRTRTEVLGVEVDEHDNLDMLHTTTGNVTTTAAFVFIGAEPRTQPFALDKDERGFITTAPDLSTSMPGVFAIGDIRAGSIKRVATAVGEGALVVNHVHAYLATRENA